MNVVLATQANLVIFPQANLVIFGKMSKVHEIVRKGKQMEPVYLGEIVAC